MKMFFKLLASYGGEYFLFDYYTIHNIGVVADTERERKTEIID